MPIPAKLPGFLPRTPLALFAAASLNAYMHQEFKPSRHYTNASGVRQLSRRQAFLAGSVGSHDGYA